MRRPKSTLTFRMLIVKRRLEIQDKVHTTMMRVDYFLSGNRRWSEIRRVVELIFKDNCYREYA